MSRADRSPFTGADGDAATRYRRLQLHARGGLGEVFVARDTELNRDVALKQIQAEFAQDPLSRSRFISEAEITGGLEHPGIVPVYGLGRYHDGRPFYAMRFVKGQTLKQSIEEFHRPGPAHGEAGARSLALRALLRRLIDVCNAVAYAHSRGVVHRDLKPSNVMLGPYGETLVVDWGLAKCLDRPNTPDDKTECSLQPSLASEIAVTKTGTVSGTPAFMSPEQAAGQSSRIGPASDVYSLGATLYTILTGRPPLEGEAPQVLLRKIVDGQMRPPRAVNPSVPRPLEAVCQTAMAPAPENRYSSARALAEGTSIAGSRASRSRPGASHWASGSSAGRRVIARPWRQSLRPFWSLWPRRATSSMSPSSAPHSAAPQRAVGSMLCLQPRSGPSRRLSTRSTVTACWCVAA